jgi:putative transposase
MLPTDPAATLLSKARRRAFNRYWKLRSHLEQDVTLTRVAAEAGVPLRTAQRWVSRYRRFGLAGLSRTERSDKGNRRRLSDDLRHLAERLALQKPPLGPGVIYREVCGVAQAGDQEPPRYHTVYNVIRALRER